MTFATKLKKLRKKAGLSQQQLADDLYISRSSLAKYENGLLEPNLDFIKSVAKYFNLQEEDIISDDTEVMVPQRFFRIFIVLHKILFVLGMVASLSFIIVGFLPILPNGKSIIISNLNNGMIIGLLTYILSILLASFLLLIRLKKNVEFKMIAYLFADIFLAILIFLITFSTIIAFGS